MSEAADQLKKEYHKRYQQDNREKLNAYKKKWRSENPDKTREYNQRYWERKVQLCMG